MVDESGPLVAVWFNQPWIARQLGEGAAVLLHGKLRRRGELWVTEHELLAGGEAPVHTIGLVPVHPASEGITAGRLRQLVWDEYRAVYDTIEPLPGRLRARERLCERAAALSAAHFPDREEDERGARRRLAFEELFLLQLAVRGPQALAPRGPPGSSARGARRRGRPLALVAPVRADRRPGAGDHRDRHRPRGRAPDAAAADGRGRHRQDGRGAGGDAARRRERRPGGADGAHGDARRAAPPHARRAARRVRCRSSCSRARRAPRAGAICSRGSRTVSSSSWSARTR